MAWSKARCQSFFKATPLGETTYATSTASHRGRSTQVGQTRIDSGEGKLIAMVTQTQMILG